MCHMEKSIYDLKHTGLYYESINPRTGIARLVVEVCHAKLQQNL
jgi:hypothetical protein